MKYRAHALHCLIQGFVQRRGHDILRTALLPKNEHVLYVRLTPLQEMLYTQVLFPFNASLLLFFF